MTINLLATQSESIGTLTKISVKRDRIEDIIVYDLDVSFESFEDGDVAVVDATIPGTEEALRRSGVENEGDRMTVRSTVKPNDLAVRSSFSWDGDLLVDGVFSKITSIKSWAKDARLVYTVQVRMIGLESADGAKLIDCLGLPVTWRIDHEQLSLFQAKEEELPPEFMTPDVGDIVAGSEASWDFAGRVDDVFGTTVTVDNFGVKFDVDVSAVTGMFSLVEVDDLDKMISYYAKKAKKAGTVPSWKALIIAMSQLKTEDEDADHASVRWDLTPAVCNEAAKLNLPVSERPMLALA